MKRSITFLLFAVFLAIMLAGCTVVRGVLKLVLPDSTDAVTETSASIVIEATPTADLETTSTPVAATAEPSPTANPNEYVSAALGIAFTMPKSWAGKYRVEEGDGYLSVYFNPTEPIKSAHEGEFFSILKITNIDEELIRNDWKFSLNGITYIWGSNAQFSYWQTDPEYNTYATMEKDIPDIFQTVRSVSGQVPDQVKRLWIEVFPAETEYTTTMGLGIAFTLPKSWIGKCRIVESEDDIWFYFYPAEPFDPNTGDGFLFFISRKVSDVDTAVIDGGHEFVVGGVTYISGTSTDVPYSEDQPEYDTYMSMGGRQEILDSVRAAK